MKKALVDLFVDLTEVTVERRKTSEVPSQRELDLIQEIKSESPDLTELWIWQKVNQVINSNVWQKQK